MGIGNRRRGKLLPSPVTPADTICIQIEVPNAVEYIAAFFGQLDILGSWYTWDHPTDLTECADCEEAAQLWRTAIYDAQRSKGMCCCEPSITDRFTANTYMTTTNTFYEETYNTWNDGGQTVGSIAPNLDFDTGDPADIDKVTCANINILLQTIIEAAIAYKRQTTQEKKDITKNLASVMAALAAAGGAAIAAGGILAAGMAFLGGPLTVFGLAVAAVGLFIANIVETTDLSVFQDAGAIEEVRCTLTQNLIGENLTRERFMAGLTPNDFDPGSNAEKLAAVVQPYLDDLNVYLQFLVEGNGLYDAVDIGALPDCEVCPAARVILVNGAPSIWPDMTLTFIANDGDWDIWDISSQTWSSAPYDDGAGHIFYYGNNIVRDIGGWFHIEAVSGMAWQSSIMYPGVGNSGTSYTAATYSQCGMFSTTAGTIRVKVKP